MSGAFLPRAFAKPQRISLPSKRTLKQHKEPESTDQSEKREACVEDSGGGRGGSERIMGLLVDIEMNDDERPEELRIQKRKQGLKRQAEVHEGANCSKKRREGGSREGSIVGHVIVLQEEATLKEERPGCQSLDGGVDRLLSEHEGATVTGRRNAGTAAKKQAKKVFPYGNYDRYYGYRFGKALAEDPRLSVIQKEWFKGKACLDIGCNEGYVTIAVAQKFECASMVGVDIDASLIAKAKGHLKRGAAALRQASKPQRRRLDLPAQTVSSGKSLSREVPSSPLGDCVVEGADRRETLSEAGNLNEVPAGAEEHKVEELDLASAALADISGSGDDVSSTTARIAEGDAVNAGKGEDHGCQPMTNLPQGRDLGSQQLAESGTQNGDCSEGPSGACRVELSQENGLDSNHEACARHGLHTPLTLVKEGDDALAAVAKAPPAEGFFPRNVTFRAENFVLSPVEEEKYDVIMSLSVVKWIHLNWGDDGLLRYFRKVHTCLKPGGLFILEPQPWKSYKNNRAVSEVTQRHFKEIKILPEHFANVLQSQIGFCTLDVVSPAVPGSLGGFGRPIHLYRKCESQ